MIIVNFYPDLINSL